MRLVARTWRKTLKTAEINAATTGAVIVAVGGGQVRDLVGAAVPTLDDVVHLASAPVAAKPTNVGPFENNGTVAVELGRVRTGMPHQLRPFPVWKAG